MDGRPTDRSRQRQSLICTVVCRAACAGATTVYAVPVKGEHTQFVPHKNKNARTVTAQNTKHKTKNEK